VWARSIYIHMSSTSIVVICESCVIYALYCDHWGIRNERLCANFKDDVEANEAAVAYVLHCEYMGIRHEESLCANCQDVEANTTTLEPVQQH